MRERKKAEDRESRSVGDQLSLETWMRRTDVRKDQEGICCTEGHPKKLKMEEAKPEPELERAEPRPDPSPEGKPPLLSTTT
jgi:hypothetical protein